VLGGRADEAFTAARESLGLVRELRDVFALIHSLLMIAAAAELQGDDVGAARLLGALDAMAATAGMTTADSLSHEVRQRTERALRARMPVELFSDAYSAGGQAEIDALLDSIRALA